MQSFIFSGFMLLTHVCVFLYSGEIKSLSDRFRLKLHRLHQRLLRPGKTTSNCVFITNFKGNSHLFLNSAI